MNQGRVTIKGRYHRSLSGFLARNGIEPKAEYHRIGSHMPEKSIYLHYTKKELDRQYDQSTLVPDSTPYLETMANASDQARKTLPHIFDVPYGNTENTKYDVYGVGGSNKPILIYIHGGAWKISRKHAYAGLANTYVPKGAVVAVIGFDNALEVSLSKIITQCRSATAHIHQHATDYGADPNRIYLSGTSSGAVNASVAAITDWKRDFGIEEDFIQGVALVSGSYDLEPVQLSARNDYLALTKEEAKQLNPALSPDRFPKKNILACGGAELEEFVRQTRDLASKLEVAGKDVIKLYLADRNHFEMGLELYDPFGPICSSISGMLELDM